MELLLRRRAAADKAKTDLITFAKYVSPDPSEREDVRFSTYQDAKHHRVIAAALEEVEAGRFKKLMISCPPRHGKTRLTSQLFPAWYIGRNPRNSIISTTYNQVFATDLGRAVRDIMQSNLYGQVFPDIHLKTGDQSAVRLATDEGAQLFWTGVGGSLTGRGGDCVLIDDPIKNRQEADSPVVRETLWGWYTTVLRSRLMTKAGTQVIITTRWHEDDLIGRMLDPANPHYNEEEAASWNIINLPALAEDDNDVLGRQEGEALWPERFDEKYLHDMRRNDARGFTALYQGRPTPADGSMYKASTLRLYHRMHELPAMESMRFYGASDHAVSTGQSNDKTCMGIIGLDADDDIWFMPDLVWGRYPADQAVEQVINLMEKYKPMLWFGEKGVISKSIGPFLRKRMLERRVFCAIDEITPVADKQQRAQSFHARVSMGKVHFPSFPRWYADARDQLLKFPSGTFDDFVDMCSLFGLGLMKQRPAKRIKVRQEGIKPMTLGWVKQMTKQAEREASSAIKGWM